MSTTTCLASGRKRVQYRVKGLQLISRTFNTELEATAYKARIDSELATIHDVEQAKLPIDIAIFFSTLHPDLKNAAAQHQMFARITGAIAGNELTLAHLIDEFVYQYNKKDKTMLERLQWWSKHFGHLTVNEMSEDYIRQGINTLLTIGSTGKRGVRPQTTNRFKANLSSVFEYGKDKYNLKHNPCRQIGGRPEGKGRKRYLTTEEQQRLIFAAKHSKYDKFYLLILLALTSGARRGELLKLTFRDILWDKSQALCSDTKNGADRLLTLTPAVMQELRKFRQIGNALIFANPRKPTTPYNFRKEWNAALQEANIDIIDDKGEKLVFHSLRHSFCSSLSNSGVSLNEIAALAGHRSLQTTLRYSHSDHNRLATVVNNTFSALG